MWRLTLPSYPTRLTEMESDLTKWWAAQTIECLWQAGDTNSCVCLGEQWTGILVREGTPDLCLYTAVTVYKNAHWSIVCNNRSNSPSFIRRITGSIMIQFNTVQEWKNWWPQYALTLKSSVHEIVPWTSKVHAYVCACVSVCACTYMCVVKVKRGLWEWQKGFKGWGEGKGEGECDGIHGRPKGKLWEKKENQQQVGQGLGAGEIIPLLKCLLGKQSCGAEFKSWAPMWKARFCVMSL